MKPGTLFRQKRKADTLLIRLYAEDERRLGQRIEEDFTEAQQAHEARMQSYRRYLRLFFGLPVDSASATQYPVTLIQEQVLMKVSREYESLFGDGAEVQAEPKGDADAAKARKAAAILSHKITRGTDSREWALWSFSINVFGVAHAYVPYERKTFATPEGEQLHSSGPGFHVIPPDELVVAPVSGAKTMEDFPYVIHRLKMTIPELLRAEQAGLMHSIKANIENLQALADGTYEIEPEYSYVDQDLAEAEGIVYGNASTAPGNGRVPVWMWYGRDYDPATGQERDFRVSYIPHANLVTGVYDLMDVYPQIPYRRPFVRGALFPVGGYWSMGFGQMLERKERELTESRALFKKAGEITAMPPIAVTPPSGLTNRNIVLGPGVVLDVMDATGIRQLDIRFDPNFSVLHEQMLRGDTERVTGQSDLTAGRDISRPTAPRTASGTLALIDQGDKRTGLDVHMAGLNAANVLERFWLLIITMGDPNEAFRISESTASGLFAVENGRVTLTHLERMQFYDFKLKLAPTAQQKEIRRALAAQGYEMAMGNPLVASDPVALWKASARAWRDVLNQDFAEIVPMPAQTLFSVPPEQEWVKILQGDEVRVSPQDDDDEHLRQHYAAIGRWMREGGGDDEAQAAIAKHIQEHVAQKRQKQLMVALVQSTVQTLRQNPQAAQNLAMLANGARGQLEQGVSDVEETGSGYVT